MSKCCSCLLVREPNTFLLTISKDPTTKYKKDPAKAGWSLSGGSRKQVLRGNIKTSFFILSQICVDGGRGAKKHSIIFPMIKKCSVARKGVYMRCPSNKCLRRCKGYKF